MGCLLSVDRILPDPEKVNSLTEAPVPADVPAAIRFVGAMGFYMRFIPRFADIVHPIREMIKSEKFYWNGRCNNAFRELKNAVKNGVVPALDVELC